jgi:tRNA A37 threonylcarbamoyladenosine modification protein TsaB
VGITLVKTYAQILKKPLVTYSNFECLLEFAPDEGKYLTILKVSRYWVYGIWEKTKEGSIEIQKPTILDEDKIKSLEGEHLRVIYPVWLEGSKEIIQKLETKDKPIEVPLRGFSEVGALVALRKYQNGQTVHPFEVEPIYFRSAV